MDVAIFLSLIVLPVIIIASFSLYGIAHKGIKWNVIGVFLFIIAIIIAFIVLKLFGAI